MTERGKPILPANDGRALSAREAVGKEARKKVPRTSHAVWNPAADRPDPVAILQEQDKERIQQLLPIKYGRMVVSPFAFLRGSAAIMANDLAGTPTTGFEVFLCGDAHLSNFGVFASPERQLVFDVNDFDEAYPGPWEWDLKRLAASAVVAARENDFREDHCREMAVSVVAAYARAMDGFKHMDALETWYYHVDVGAVQKAFAKLSDKTGVRAADKMARKARTRTRLRSLEELTEIVEGRRRIRSAPPLLVPARDLSRLMPDHPPQESTPSDEDVRRAWGDYLESVPIERRFLLRRFRVADVALRVGGVGSVGTRCTIMLLEDENTNSGLIMQQKEAGSSVLEAHLPKRSVGGSASRVVSAQRLMQATSDIFLGRSTGTDGSREYYWRQLKDMKGSFDVTAVDKGGLETYVQVCAYCLARAHARTGDSATISGYIGMSDRMAQAIGDFAVLYADQTEKDHRRLEQAIKTGRIRAEEGI